MQQLMLIGRLGSDLEDRIMPNGGKVSTFSFAVNTMKKKEAVTTWYKITLFEMEFVGIRPYLTKGRQFIIGGELDPPRPYLSKKGEAKVELSLRPHMIKFPPFKSTEDKEEEALSSSYDMIKPPAAVIDIDDLEIPF